MLLALLALCLGPLPIAVHAVQEPLGAWSFHPEDDLHLQRRLRLGIDEAVVELESPVDGWVGIWVESGGEEPALRIDVEGHSSPIAYNGSGRPGPASVVFEVGLGGAMAIELSGGDAAPRDFDLHVVFAPETAETREAARRAHAEIGEIEPLRLEQRIEEIRTRLSQLTSSLEEVPGAERSREIGSARWAVGNTAYGLHFVEDARRNWSAALRCRMRLLPTDHPDVLVARQNVAVSLKELGDYRSARDLELAVLHARQVRLPVDDIEVLHAKQNLAVTCKGMGDIEIARTIEQEVLEAFERTLPPDHFERVRAMQNLAATRAELRDFSGAERLQKEVLASFEKSLPADDPDLLYAKGNLAATRALQGDMVEARRLQEEVLATCRRVFPAGHPDLLWASGNLAKTLRDLGDLGGAIALQEQVLSGYSELLPASVLDVLDAKASIALTRKAFGDFAGAEVLEEEVLSERLGLLHADHPALLSARYNLAATLFNLGDLAECRKLQTELVDFLERLRPPNHPDVLAAKQNLASMHLKLGELEQAESIQKVVLSTYELLLQPDDPRILLAKSNLAEARRSLGDLAGARALQVEVLAARERLLPLDHLDLLWAKGNLAETLRQLRDSDGLRKLCGSILASEYALASRLGRFSPRFARSASIGELERLAWISFWARSCGSAGQAELAPSLAESLEAFRGAFESSSWVWRKARELPGLRAKLAELEDVKREAAAIAHGPHIAAGAVADEAVVEWRREMLATSEHRDRLETDIRAYLDGEGFRRSPPRVRDLASCLGPGEALVSYWRCERLEESEATRSIASVSWMLAFVTTPDGLMRSIDLGPAAELEGLIQQWRSAVGQPLLENSRGVALESGGGVADPGPCGDTIRARLLDPVLADLPEVGELHVVLDDLLFLIPLDALPMGEGVVGDRLRIVCLTNVSPLLDSARDREGSPRFVAVGGVDYASEGEQASDPAMPSVAGPPESTRGGSDREPWDSFASLPSAGAEVDSVGETFSEAFDVEAEILRGSGATKAAVFARAPGARFFHIATHGWFVPAGEFVSWIDTVGRECETKLGRSAQMRTQEALTGFLPETLCGLALAGANRGRDSLGRVPGILTAEELATLDLSQCDLAVLSACETNVGIRRAGQGIQSLQTALHAAGARTAITSLWKVDDAATRQLFEVFYTKLWRDGLGPAEALWQAKLALREAGHPLRDWAGWVLTGAPD